VSKSSSDSQVASEVVDSITSGVRREALFSKGSLVKRPVGVEDGVLIVLRTVGVEEILREEGELSGVPSVRSVHAAEDDAAETDTREARKDEISQSSNWNFGESRTHPRYCEI